VGESSLLEETETEADTGDVSQKADLDDESSVAEDTAAAAATAPIPKSSF
jgi:hypothetical protein